MVRYFIPSFVSIGLGLFFLWFQALAVFVVVAAFLGFGIAYALIVSRLLQARLERSREDAASHGASDAGGPSEPAGFRQVTIVMARKSGWLKD
jgi:hypothetical protein